MANIKSSHTDRQTIFPWSVGCQPTNFKTKMDNQTQTYRRRPLPHFHHGEYQFITYRLADALPQQILAQIRLHPDSNVRKKMTEQILDRHYGSCILQQPEIAQIIIENWQHFHGKRYEIQAHVVMPNHIHILIRVYPQQNLTQIVHSWKSYTANRIRQHLSAYPQPVWQANYWDRYIRDERHFQNAVYYIENNPVKAGLVEYAESWPYSSANKKWSGTAAPHSSR